MASWDCCATSSSGRSDPGGSAITCGGDLGSRRSPEGRVGTLLTGAELRGDSRVPRNGLCRGEEFDTFRALQKKKEHSEEQRKGTVCSARFLPFTTLEIIFRDKKATCEGRKLTT
uniref:Uncharacterized protein n=1 Tax=Steinernema glaseri TaxID=37863 RepID=A0A1I8AUE1_9BILA